MSPPPALDAAGLAALRSELEAIEGVARAVIEGPPYRLYLICEPTETTPTELLVQSVLARHGLGGNHVEVQACFLPTSQPRRRVRFVRSEIRSTWKGARAMVELEWSGQTFSDTLEGESGAALELRLTALATLRVLEAVLQHAISFQLVGIKGFRAFDADVVVVVLRAGDEDHQQLIGASLATEDPHRSAALAVLNATNRLLGNYLNNVDS